MAAKILDEVREYEIDKYDAEEALRDELHRVIDEEYKEKMN